MMRDEWRIGLNDGPSPWWRALKSVALCHT